MVLIWYGLFRYLDIIFKFLFFEFCVDIVYILYNSFKEFFNFLILIVV